MNPPIPSPSNSPSKSTSPLLPNFQQKTLFLSVFKTIIHMSLDPLPGRHNFSVKTVTKEKTSTLYVTLRPGLHEFLQAAKKACFEIVTFTKRRRYMSWILRQIDPTGEIITHQLFHDDCCPETGKRKDIIDLNQTGRMLDRSVIIHYNPKSHVKPWCNAIKVGPFTGDTDDVELSTLLSFFEAQGKFKDVRHIIHVSKARPIPSLPLPRTTRKTLFLDMDETLIHHVRLGGKPPDQYDFTIECCYIIKRPGVDKLLQVATDHDYDIVIFTAGSRKYASPIIDKLDPNGLIAHRLYRDSCKRNEQGICIKDLALTGRSLDRCLIVDDGWQRVLQRDNVVRIKPFKGDMQDSELTKLLHYFSIERRYENLQDAVSHMNHRLSNLKD